MKIYGIYTSMGVLLAKVAKRSIDEAEVWFRATYPHRGFGYIAEM